MMWPYYVMVGTPALVALLGNHLKNRELKKKLKTVDNNNDSDSSDNNHG